jgi:hypothetical protein
MVPLAILRCKAEERLYLATKTNPEGLGDEWTIARDKNKWKSRQLVLVVTTGQGADEIGYVGLADRGRWTGTHQGDLVVTGLSRLAGPIGFRDMTAAVPTFAKKYLEDEGVVTPRARDVILTAAFALRPGLSEVVDKLLKQQPPISVPGPVGRLAAQFRDACGLSMMMAGLSRDPLNDWAPPRNLERQEGSFVHSLPEGRAQERDLHEHDASMLEGWFGIGMNRLAWRRYAKGEQRLLIANVDGKREEIALGVDLIYYHEDRKCFTLVQYKPLEHKNDDWVYYPSDDGHIAGQLDRMRAVDAKCLQSMGPQDDYRLSVAPSWIKLCRTLEVIPRTDELIRGMYLTREYFEQLKNHPSTPCRGEKGAVKFAYSTVPRYLDNTTFSQLVSDGWIGSSGTGTDLIAEQVQACRDGKREPIVAFASGQTPKAQKVRERMRG